jgi:ABC-type multidrug transport system ATPase subunit
MTPHRKSGASVTVQNLAVSFARWGQKATALKDVSLRIASGEWLLLVGQNGAGKSTLLKAIGGRLRPDSGRVTIGDRDVQDLSPRDIARTVFMVHQDPFLGTAPLLTVFENMMVADPHALHGHESRANLLDRYMGLLSPIGLTERARQPAKLLSGGERQLLTMVIAGLREAELVLLDEPLASLDRARADICTAEIQRMHRQGKTIIQVAHDIRALESIANRVVTLQDGRVTAPPSCEPDVLAMTR